MQIRLLFCICLTVFLFLGNNAFAGKWVKYSKPIHPRDSAYRLDWCKTWATDCGAPAAGAFCKAKGFQPSTKYFEIDNNIGLTKIIGTNGQVCHNNFCDGFKHIWCKRWSETIYKPKYKKDRLDWCKNWASDCGKPAADAYCKYLGYKRSSRFEIDIDVGYTRLITGSVCDAGFCDSFKYIRCIDF